jgi:hypothetical protein
MNHPETVPEFNTIEDVKLYYESVLNDTIKDCGVLKGELEDAKAHNKKLIVATKASITSLDLENQVLTRVNQYLFVILMTMIAWLMYIAFQRRFE